MADENEDVTMVMMGFGGRILATRELALTMAETIIRDVDGEDDLDLQKPLKITDSGDRWFIEGSREYDRSIPPGEVMHGPVEIEISKANCRVLKFRNNAAISPWPQ